MSWSLTAVATAAAAASEAQTSIAEFAQWANENGRQYEDEDARRQALIAYQSNSRIIDELNAEAEDSAEYGHTRFSDMHPQEFTRAHLPLKMDPISWKFSGGGRGEFVGAHTTKPSAPPAAFDWRSVGAVTPVKDQSACGSCWAESAVSNIESAWFLASRQNLKVPVELSVQQVIECDAHDNACYGGFSMGAYQYVIEHGGLARADSYPYNVSGHTVCLANQTFNMTCGDGICDDPPLTNACDQTCSDNAEAHKSVARIDSWLTLPADEDAIVAYLAEHGPVAVGVDASGGMIGVLFPWLQFYKRGIANPRRCTSKIDHGVLIVGYGEEQGEKYWIIKNSWGPKWGESGYFRLVRGVGKCGVALMASSAVVTEVGTLVVV